MYTQLLFSIFTFAQLAKISLSQNLQTINGNLPVFQPFPLSTLQPTSLCQNATTDVMALFTQSQKNMLALNLELCGFAIYDLSQLSSGQVELIYHAQFNQDKGSVLSLSVTDEQKFLWVGYTKGILEIYDLSQQSFPMIYSSNITFYGNQDNVNKVIQFPNQNVTFLACLNNFKMVNFINNQLSIIQTYNLSDWNIIKMRFALNQSVLVVLGYTSLHFYQQTILSFQQGQLNLTCNYQPSTAYILSSFEVIQESILVVQISLSQYIMIDITKYIASYDGKTCNVNTITTLNTYPSTPLGNNFALSKDGKFLYTQQSSLGILIFDVSQKSLQVFQSVKINGYCGDLQLSDDENFVFYSNQYNVQIFQTTAPNLNLDKPNLLLNQYQLTSYSFYKTKGFSFDNQIIFQQPSNYLYMARKDQGSAIFQYQGSGTLQLKSQIQNGIPNISIAYQAIVPGTSIFYQSREILGLQIADCSNITAPVVLKQNITFNLTSIKFEMIVFNSKGTLAFIANLVNLLILNTTDILNPVLLSVLNTHQYLNGDQSLYKFMLSNDEKTLLLCAQLYGITFADVTNPQQPYFLFQLEQQNINFIQQTMDSKYLIAGLRFYGVYIYTINQDRSITFLSSVQINGVLYFQWLIYQDNYLVVGTGINNYIFLVNLVDKANPFVVQSVSLYGNRPIYWISSSQDQSFVFVSAYSALYQLFLQSSIIIHSQYYLLTPIENTNQYSRQLLNIGQPLMVGQQIEIYLVNIYQAKNLQISQAFYYQNLIVQNLPSWMQYSPTTQVLSLQVSRDSLIPDQNGMYVGKTLQQVIFLSYQQIAQNAFINSNLNITASDSSSIWSACMKVGYLNNQGYISSTYSPLNMFTLGGDQQTAVYLAKWNSSQSQIQSILNFVQFILNQNIINYVVQFQTQSSLIVNFTNQAHPIQSNQQQVTVTLQTSNGKFVQKTYPGILSVINSLENVIQLQGSISSINFVLFKTIKLSLTDNSQNSTKISIVIDDSINYKYITTLNLNQATFISQQSPVLLIGKLQQDFNQQYPGGEIAIQTAFSYKLNSSIFVCKDSQQLIYSAQIKIKDQYQNIPQGYWLSFSSNEQTFVGNPQSNIYYESFTVKVQVTDGYTVVEDELVIKVDLVPFMYIVQILIQIIGPILGIFGVWKYRTSLYNTIYKSRCIYTQEIVYVSQYYEKNIIIASDTLSYSLQLWKQVKNNLPVELVQQQINQAAQNKELVAELLKKYSQIYEKNQNKPNFLEELQKSINPYLNHYADSNDEEQSYKIQKQFRLLSLSDKNQIPLKSNTFKDSPLSPELSRNNLIDSPSQGFLRKQKSISDKNQKIMRKFSIQQKKINQSLILEKQIDTNASKKLFKDHFQIDFNSIKNMIFQIQTSLPVKKQILSKQQIKQLNMPESRLQITIKGLATQYFVLCSPICSYIVQKLKEKALQIYKQIDWYRAYVTYQPQIIDENTYPKYTINYDCFKIAIQEILHEMQQQQQLFQLFPQNNETVQTENNNSKNYLEYIVVYLPLIEEYIFAQALGISNQTKRKYQISQGDTLHCKPFKIRSIKCFEKSQGFSCCHSLQEFLGMNMVEKGLSENQRLPEWMQVEYKKSHISIKGTPSQEHAGLSRLKIYDLDGYLLRQFDIKVMPQKKDSVNDPQITQQVKLLQSQNTELNTLLKEASPQFQSTCRGYTKSHSDEILEEEITSVKRYISIEKKSNNKNFNTLSEKQEQNFSLQI
ncbi:hypothetical protein TTHERM_00058580 (macronuclear) [Tetrahymena thermophila SB210]|uniref:Transmembrane protein n=1 Tax=Tetrahymena thermophila (strain SB210) TaxID=312017 RepID=I7M0D1_TETTS|nr:hypothetical protein TTHERM_00058580 [Tetrahymena thermophila SB210]EAR87346.2 hypothetical protein TTHERM_00058580 [Tetrahymena thermophila SB210]|eukprot:XP_001007591.2 hypothetical protein TTHERM_00058580 [Tetrahymena thermophila SB210]